MNFKNKRPRVSRAGCFCGGKYDKKVTGEEKRKYIDPPDESKSLSVAKKSKKKDTKRWCKGKEGREHVTRWEPNHNYSGIDRRPNAEFKHEELVCVDCRKVLDLRTIHLACGEAHDKWGMGWYLKNRETGRYERKPYPCEAKAA